jgi:GT2 family glycosyltransferase
VRTGVVVPTLGQRPELLLQAIDSIRTNPMVFICLVGPESIDRQSFKGSVDLFVNDPGRGLPAAINLGISSLPQSVEFVTWLGDDDLLAENALDLSIQHMVDNKDVCLVFGSCRYIDESSKQVWMNKSGQWAARIIRFGPFLTPQPGSVIRRTAFEQVGGLDENLGWAFDLDLFIKLSKVGKLRFVGLVLSSFRWHESSLTVEFRRQSVREASSVRKKHLHFIFRLFSEMWEFPIRFITQYAPIYVVAQTKFQD